MSGKRKTMPEEALRALEEAALDAELARIKALSDADVARELREQGGDPDAIGARGASLVAGLEAKRRREAWQADARQKLEAARRALAPGPKKARGLTRAELVARIEAARSDAATGGPLAVAFRGRKLDESSDAELEAMLDAIEALERLEETLP